MAIHAHFIFPSRALLLFLFAPNPMTPPGESLRIAVKIARISRRGPFVDHVLLLMQAMERRGAAVLEEKRRMVALSQTAQAGAPAAPPAPADTAEARQPAPGRRSRFTPARTGGKRAVRPSEANAPAEQEEPEAPAEQGGGGGAGGQGADARPEEA